MTATPSPTYKPSSWLPLLPWLIPLVAWLFLFDRLRIDWAINAQYSYGWIVPVLGGMLLWRRWKTRPPARTPQRGGLAVDVVVAAILLTWLPLEIVLEANPEWRMAFWIGGALAAALSLALLWRAGGWPWVRHGAFPVLFLLIAIPWPTNVEQSVIQGLMRGVAAMTVEVLDVVGIAAIQMGNVIELSEGIVGVDEACSGVRSVQTTLLVALTLGELFELSWVRRVALLGLGLLVAIFANFMRTLVLVLIASNSGIAELERWHDVAGFAVLFLVLGALAGLGRLLTRRNRVPSRPEAHAGGANVPWPTAPVALGLMWLLLIPVVNEWWYRTRETSAGETIAWTMNWSTAGEQKELDIGERARGMLRCDRDRGATWTDADGRVWQMYLLEWEAGRNSIHLARSHRPEICLTGVGMQLTADLGARNWSHDGLELIVRQYEFSERNRPLHVFYTLWEGGSGLQPVVPGEYGAAERIGAAVKGLRQRAQRVVQIAVAGPANAEQAWQLVKEELEHRLEIKLAAR